MTSDFYSGFIVVLDSDMDEEKMKMTLNTLSMIKGVIDVKPVEKEKTEQRIQKSRIKNEIMQVISDAVNKM